MIKKVALMLMVFFCVCGLTLSIAQDEYEYETKETIGYSYGRIISVSSTKLDVSEFDLDSDEMVQMSYVINSDTEFVNVESYSDLMIDDEVEIEFEKAGEEKIARTITKEIEWQPAHELEYEGGEESPDTEYMEDAEDATRDN